LKHDGSKTDAPKVMALVFKATPDTGPWMPSLAKMLKISWKSTKELLRWKKSFRSGGALHCSATSARYLDIIEP
jgi:hypothetical protein